MLSYKDARRLRLCGSRKNTRVKREETMKRKIVVLLLTALVLSAACFGCGKNADQADGSDVRQTSEEGQGSDGQDADGGSGEEQDADADSAQETDGETEEGSQEEDGPLVYDHFTGGTLYEEGKYLFRIDSMGMTEEGYEIQYTVSADSGGYSSYYEMQVIVNGISTSFSGITFYNDTEDGQKGSGEMLGSTDTPARMVIGKEYLEKLGASQVNSLFLHVELGQSAYNTITISEEIDCILYPGDVVGEDAIFPEPERESWVLVDNEYGKVQILRAVYEENRNGDAQVHAYILTKGTGGEDFPRYGIDVKVFRLDGRVYSFNDWRNQHYTMKEDAVLYEASLYDSDIPFEDCEEGFISPVKISLKINGEETETDAVLDFTHLEYE